MTRVWLISTIRRYRRVTFEELNQKWIEDQVTDGNPLQRSTFNRHRDELTKYARIRVDIPNSLDDIWGIDIKKQSATIPLTIRKRLTKAVDDAMDISVRNQSYRGRTSKVDENKE